MVSATSALGISVGLIGPFVYHDLVKSESLNPSHLAALFAGRGFGSFLGAILSIYLLEKSNQSFWMCASLLVLAASIVLIPWATGIIVLTLGITVQGLLTSVAKRCSQNLLRFYHGFPPMGGTVQKLMHVAFGFGCFLALLCVIMFTSISSLSYPQTSNNEVILNISNDQGTHQLPAKSIARRSVTDNLNSSNEDVNEAKFKNLTKLALNSSVATKNSTIPEKLLNLTTVSELSTSTLGGIRIGNGNNNETSSDNDTQIFLNSSSPLPPAFNATTLGITVVNATIRNVTVQNATNVTTTPVPIKPAVLDSNNHNHHKESADGKGIKEALKQELEKNPLEVVPPKAPSANLPSTPSVLLNSTTPSITTVSSEYSTSNETIASLNHNATSGPDHLGTSDVNNEEGQTTTDKQFLQTTFVDKILPDSNSTEIEDLDNVTVTTGAEGTFNLSSIKTTNPLLNVPASSTTTVTISPSPKTTTISKNFLTSTVALSSTVKNSMSSSESARTTNSTTVHRDLINRTGLPSHGGSIKPSTGTTVALKAPVLLTTMKTSTKSNFETVKTTETKVQERQVVITQLEQLEAFLKSTSQNFGSPTNGFYILSLIVFLVSGMLAVNSGICGKSKGCRSYPEVNYTCSEKDPLSFRSSVCVRLSTVTFHWAYVSVEILTGGLLASYFVSIGGVPLYVGVAATGMFWFGFFCGRLAFLPLSSFAKMFRLTFLAAFLTIACLVAFLCMLHSASSLPWYFFACMIFLAAFFFSMVGPSFQGYRENFPLLSYDLPLQDVLCSLGEAAIPPLVCSLVFAGGGCHLVSLLIALTVACLLSVLCFKFFVSSIPKKLKSSRRKPSFTSDNWGENGEEAEVLTSSFDNGSTTKPLLLP